MSKHLSTIAIIGLLGYSTYLLGRTIALENRINDLQAQIDSTYEMVNLVADDVIDIVEGNEIGTTDH